MREIRFRKYHNGRFDYLSLTKSGLSVLQNESYSINYPGIWQQYTGLKDKNGKDVYEGDICSHQDGEKFYIEWHEIRFGLVAIYPEDEHEDEDVLPLRSIQNYEIEVIGNIHENKELLK